MEVVCCYKGNHNTRIDGVTPLGGAASIPSKHSVTQVASGDNALSYPLGLVYAFADKANCMFHGFSQ